MMKSCRFEPQMLREKTYHHLDLSSLMVMSSQAVLSLFNQNRRLFLIYFCNLTHIKGKIDFYNNITNDPFKVLFLPLSDPIKGWPVR